jgi:hypothetical protein
MAYIDQVLLWNNFGWKLELLHRFTGSFSYRISTTSIKELMEYMGKQFFYGLCKPGFIME